MHTAEWIQTIAIIVAVAASLVSLIIAHQDRRNTRDIATKDRRFNHLQTQLEYLVTIRDNLKSRDGHDGFFDIARIRAVGPELLPKIWNRQIRNDDSFFTDTTNIFIEADTELATMQRKNKPRKPQHPGLTDPTGGDPLPGALMPL
ncbi:MAG: hypothetical protein GXW98_05720 [Bifidobacterium crudilactis]|uniref:Uncharacterized protein n=1 Tax=Bifidobacterium crudilactis TaxID=327277 RepID=A0A971ID16_9BIFI|nr:hypothetical protein [Bifidobacterium crudilactis]NLT79761.1 hypothetical protein [Bifidobacterium crudilactis]